MPMVCAATTVPMILVVLAAMPLPAALADTDFIARTCKNSDNAQCVAVLSAEPRSVNATTVLELAGIALDIATCNAEDSGGIINDRARGYEGMPEGETLDFCNQVYADAAADLVDAWDSLSSGEYADAAQLVSGAEDAGDKCEKAFANINVKSLVADVDQRMKDRCGVAGDLIDLLYFA